MHQVNELARVRAHHAEKSVSTERRLMMLIGQRRAGAASRDVSARGNERR
jgi:hypothetical protein